jgi:RimJ/RimL family protein N-acetyltransferase
VSERRVTLVELDDVLAMQLRGAAPASLTHAEGFPRTQDLEAVAAWERGALGFLIVDPDGSVVGTCGTHRRPSSAGAIELGWGLVEAARGEGVGSEAVALLLDAVRTRYPSARIVVRTEWDHADGALGAVSPSSEAILVRLGFAPGPVPAKKGPRGWTLSAPPH